MINGSRLKSDVMYDKKFVMDHFLCLINELTKGYLYEVRSDSLYVFSQKSQGVRFSRGS